MSLIWNLLHFENSYLFFNNRLQNLQTRPEFSNLFPWLLNTLNGMIPQYQCEKHTIPRNMAFVALSPAFLQLTLPWWLKTFLQETWMWLFLRVPATHRFIADCQSQKQMHLGMHFPKLLPDLTEREWGRGWVVKKRGLYSITHYSFFSKQIIVLIRVLIHNLTSKDYFTATVEYWMSCDYWVFLGKL